MVRAGEARLDVNGQPEFAGQDLSRLPSAAPGRRVQHVTWFLGVQAAREQFHLVTPPAGQAGAGPVAADDAGDVAVGLAVAGEDESSDHGHGVAPSRAALGLAWSQRKG